VLSSK
jgi:hypothetical protein